MNEINPLEEQLQSWTLRKPSAEIRSRLFHPGTAKVLDRSQLFPWLVPVTACAVAIVLLLNFTGARLSRIASGSATELFAASSSNTKRNLWAKLDFPLNGLGLNFNWTLLSGGSLRWTNPSVSSSSNGSLQLAKTNLLMR